MDEFELIQRYFAQAQLPADVAVGVGDDGAVLSMQSDKQLVSVVDTLVADVHFPASTEAYDIGFRAVAVNLSDIAAMGARPRWMTLALTLPGTDDDWLEAFSRGLQDAASPYGVALVGGDTTAGPTCVVSVHISGDVDSDKALTRQGAQPGDTLYVSGTVGDAAAGLALIEADAPNDALSTRFLRPTARVALGQLLIGHASAAIDVSDGLVADIKKLLAASGVGGVLNIGTLPISSALADAFDIDSQREFALTGGDDYELCFTAATIPNSLAGEVTAIGTITDQPGLTCVLDGQVVEIDNDGYTHFS